MIFPYNNWGDFLTEERAKKYFKRLENKLRQEDNDYVIYPDLELIWRPFELTDPHNIKVVIVADEPFNKPHEADGLALSGEYIFHDGVTNLFRKVEDDLKIKCNWENGNLERWAKQGVFLINIELTVRAGRKNSHHGIGWWRITLNAINLLYQDPSPKVFLLFGRWAARSPGQFITPEVNPNHLVIKGGYVTEREFFNKKYFSLTEEHLKKHYGVGINWS